MTPPEFPLRSSPTPSRIDRRTALKWMLTAAASTALLDTHIPSAIAADTPAKPGTVGYGQDPDLLKNYQPGELWPLTFTDDQRRTAAALCDTIIPADEKSPAASAVDVPAFIDEWISAPYPGHDSDRRQILEGFAWLDAESQRRFQKKFSELAESQRDEIAADLSVVAKAKPEHETAAQFFRRYRDLTAGGFYTTPAGMKDIGYTGNVPLGAFMGPSREVLAQLGR